VHRSATDSRGIQVYEQYPRVDESQYLQQRSNRTDLSEQEFERPISAERTVTDCGFDSVTVHVEDDDRDATVRQVGNFCTGQNTCVATTNPM